MSDPTKVVIQISTPADVSGAVASTAAIKDVGKATGAAATSTQAQAKATNELGENFEKGAAAGRVLSEVSRGNVFAFGQLGAAIKTIGVLLKTNLIGALFTLGAVAANILLPIIAGFMDKKKAVEDSTKAVEAATKAVKDLGEQRLETLQGALALIDETAKRTLEDLNDALDSAEKLADAQDRLAIARIEADPNLSESAKITARAGIADSAAARRSAAAISLAEGVVGARRNAAQGASSVESSAAGRFNEASGRVESAASFRRNLEGQVSGVRSEMANAAQGSLGFNEPAYLAAAGRLDELTDKIALLNAPEGQAREAGLKTDLLAATTALNDANKAALKSAEDLAESERKLAKVRADQAAIVPVEKQIREIQTAGDLKTAAVKDTEAATLTTAGTQAGRFGSFGRNVANGAGADTGLASVATALSAAAKAAQTDGTTREEVQAVIAAAQDLARELAARKQESTALNAALRTLTTQMQTVRTR
jgi:hypothetical protein